MQASTAKFTYNAAERRFTTEISDLGRELNLIDFWCRDCQESFLAPTQDPNLQKPEDKCHCSQCNGTNTYEACRD